LLQPVGLLVFPVPIGSTSGGALFLPDMRHDLHEAAALQLLVGKRPVAGRCRMRVL